MHSTTPYWGDRLTRACICAFGLTGLAGLAGDGIIRWRTGSFPEVEYSCMTYVWPLFAVAAFASLVAAVSHPTRWWLMLAAVALTLAFGLSAVLGLILLCLCR